MCFSADASFMAAAIVAIAGTTALIRTQRREDLALAAVPVIFAAQQSTEGLLWLTLPLAVDRDETRALTVTFLLFAKVLWPIYAPLAALLAEPAPERRQVMVAILAMGAGVALYFLWSVLAHAPVSHIGDGHIVYSGEPAAPLPVMVAYFAAVSLAAGISSFPPVRLFGLIVVAGSLISYLFYWQAFSSVWCFFAAAASVVVVFHFERLRQMRSAAMKS